MTTEVGRSESRSLTRRELVRASALAGAAVWTAPSVIGSMGSPAAAGTPHGGKLVGLSYALVVFENLGQRYVVRFTSGSGSCTNERVASVDVANSALGTCNGTTYSIDASGDLQGTGTAFGLYGGFACPAFLSVANQTVTAQPATSIVFGLAYSVLTSCSFSTLVPNLIVKCPIPMSANSVTFTCP